MKSIKTKILVVVISGLLVITAVVSAIAVNMTHEIMHKDADRILNNECLKEAAYINDILGDMLKSANIMEHFSTLEIENANQLKNEQFRAEYLAKTRGIFEEIALHTDGIDGFFMRINPEFSNSKTGYYCIIDNEKIIDKTVTDLSKYSPTDKQNVSWYYDAVNAGKAVWLAPYFYPQHDHQFISYVVPMYVGSDLIGVIGLDMNFTFLLEKVNEISVYEDGYASLVAADKTTYYNDTDRVHSGDPHTKATAELENGMFLELRSDYKDIQRDIHPMLSKIVFAFLVVLTLAIIYTIFVTHRIVRPLRKLTKAAKAIASGNSNTDLDDVPIDSKDEIGTLSRVLTNTYAKIQEYTTYINALAYRDSLTGIKNSTAYTEAVDELNKEIRCLNPQFGVIVADINNLKQTNDKYGHDVGNQLIVRTAKILMDTFKTSAVFRIGGDEFVIILRGNDLDDYHALLKKFDESCRSDCITVLDHQIPVSIARGVAVFDQSIDGVYEDVFSNADHAMYLNKEESKERVV